MVIAVPKEVKNQEFRVGLTPEAVRALCDAGHQVLVETGAGTGSGIQDDEYLGAGAQLCDTAAQVYGEGDLIVKVKEPVAQEYALLQGGKTLFTYLHLAAEPALAKRLLDCGMTAMAYETVQLSDGSLPLLMPMSLIAGRMAPQVGAFYLQREQGGRGVLLSGAPGVSPGRVVILGAGTVGANAARIALGMGADVRLLDINPARLAELDQQYGGRIRTLMAHSTSIEEQVRGADLLIGAVLLPGARAPELVSRALVGQMQPGSVIVDVAVDQGGCVATSKRTYHDAPVFTEQGVLHYGVANMPGAVSRTSTYALTNSTLPYVLKLAAGVDQAMALDPALARGLNVRAGKLYNRAVADSLGLPCAHWKAPSSQK